MVTKLCFQCDFLSIFMLIQHYFLYTRVLTKKYCSTSSLCNKKQPTTVRSLSIHQLPHLLLAWTLTKMIHSHV